MKKITLCLLLSVSIGANAQKETDNWYFGQLAGVTFSSGSAVALTNGALNTNEGCAAMSSSTGALLFYTDGVKVYNKNHVAMPNGSGLMGDLSSTQSALIVPRPGSNTQYFLFTTAADLGSNGFRYSIVDMSLQAGLGDVTSKNTAVLSPVTERLTAVKQTGGSNYWVAIHEWNNTAFDVYPLTSAGLGTAVKTNIGIKHNNSKIQNSYGQMKFSPCGKKLAVACGYLDTVQVFDFNDVTGVLSNPITLPMGGNHVYGIEFSENASRLYVSTYDPNATLVQYDLTLSSATAIKNSKLTLSQTPDIYGLQLANDGKIYAVKSFSQFLGVINSPNTLGTGCNYSDIGLDLDPNSAGVTAVLSLPGFPQNYFIKSNCATSVGIHDEPEMPEVYPNPFNKEINIGNLNEEALITVANLQGQVMISKQVSGNAVLVSEGLAAGIYFMNINARGKSFNYKVIKW